MIPLSDRWDSTTLAEDRDREGIADDDLPHCACT